MRVLSKCYLFLNLPQPSHHTGVLRELLTGGFRTVFVSNGRPSADYLVHSNSQELVLI